MNGFIKIQHRISIVGLMVAMMLQNGFCNAAEGTLRGIHFKAVDIITNDGDPDIVVTEWWMSGDKACCKVANDSILFDGDAMLIVFSSKQQAVGSPRKDQSPRQKAFHDMLRKFGSILGVHTLIEGELKNKKVWPGKRIGKGDYEGIPCEIWESEEYASLGGGRITTWLAEKNKIEPICQFVMWHNQRIAAIHQIRNLQMDVEIPKGTFSVPPNVTITDTTSENFEEILRGSGAEVKSRKSSK